MTETESLRELVTTLTNEITVLRTALGNMVHKETIKKYILIRTADIEALEQRVTELEAQLEAIE